MGCMAKHGKAQGMIHNTRNPDTAYRPPGLAVECSRSLEVSDGAQGGGKADSVAGGEVLRAKSLNQDAKEA